jgi:hypothetical protein
MSISLATLQDGGHRGGYGQGARLHAAAQQCEIALSPCPMAKQVICIAQLCGCELGGFTAGLLRKRDGSASLHLLGQHVLTFVSVGTDSNVRARRCQIAPVTRKTLADAGALTRSGGLPGWRQGVILGRENQRLIILGHLQARSYRGVYVFVPCRLDS